MWPVFSTFQSHDAYGTSLAVYPGNGGDKWSLMGVNEGASATRETRKVFQQQTL